MGKRVLLFVGTNLAIMVLMGFLILMNALAIYLRKRFELK